MEGAEGAQRIDVTVERTEVEKIEESPLSLMPEGLLDALKPEQARELIAYLVRPPQVPLPGGQNH